MTKGMPRQGGNGSCLGGYLGGYFRIRQSVVLCYWLIPKSNNCLSCFYTISLGGKAVTFLLPLSQGYLPHKANSHCIFLAAETLLLPISRRRNSALGGKFCYRQENLHDSAQICHCGKSPASKSPARGSAENCLPAVSAESPAWAGKSALAGNMPDSAQLCRGRFTNSVPADVIVAALAGSECYQPGLLQYSSQSGFNLLLHFLPSAGNSAKTQETTARNGQISVEALAPPARLWELVLNDLNDGFVEVPGALWAGIWAGNMPRQELGQVLLRQEFLPDTSLCAAMVEVSLFRSPLKCMYTLHLANVPEGMNI
ncbi:hypothetical protein V6N12_035611 [Hibiscus sabdariffa]|uniref:Uncharacterized protein n=1 Tax=Hibiscus sabdariffa TaxID=183260 RepID=A0ABR2ENM8_9ROSI